MREEIVLWCTDRERNGDRDTGLVLCVGPDCPNYDQGWCIQIRAMQSGSSRYMTREAMITPKMRKQWLEKDPEKDLAAVIAHGKKRTRA